MATAGEKIYEWDRHPRMPVPSPPRRSCDMTLLRKILVDNPARLHGFE